MLELSAGWVEEALLVEQESETMETLSTLIDLLEVSVAPEIFTVCPTCSFRLAVSPVRVKLWPLASRSE